MVAASECVLDKFKNKTMHVFLVCPFSSTLHDFGNDVKILFNGIDPNMDVLPL